MTSGKMATLAIALVIALIWTAEALAQPRPGGKVIGVQGRVEYVSGGTTRIALVQQDLFQNDVVRTGDSSRAAILLADETRVKLNSNSALRIKQVPARPTKGFIPAALRATSTLLELIGGEGWIQTPDPPQSIEIETPNATASIRGTEFSIMVSADESRITLLQGRVELSNPLGSVVLERGELGIARRGEPPRRQVLVNPEDAVQWSLYYPASISARDFAFLSTEPGWSALTENRPDEAIRQFSAAPASATSQLGLALAHYRRGDLDAAAAALDDANRRFGPSAPLLTQRALIHLLRGEVSSANDALDNAQRADANFAPALGLRSNIALTQNRKEEALALARKAVAANPNSPTAHIDLSLALQAHFDLAAALEAARKAAELDPQNTRAHVQHARMLLGFERIEEASAAAGRARTIDANEAQVLATYGFIALARLDTDAAIADFQKSVATGAPVADGYLGLGLAAFRKGELDNALAHFEAAALLEPRVSLYQSYLGKALYQLERREDALAALERAKLLDPRDPTPELYRGIMLTDLNRPADAIAAYQKSIELNDNRAVSRSRLVLDRDLASRNINLTRAYLALGQGDRALAAGIRALHEDPQSSSAHLFYGLSLFNLFGDFQRSSSELLQTQILQPVNQNILNDVAKSGTDYTMLIEQPKIQGSLEGSVGNLETRTGSLFVTAAKERFAGEQFFNYGRTDGPKRHNSDQRTWSSTTFVKWAPTYRSSLFFEAFHFDLRGGDTFLNARAFTANDPDLRQSAKATRFRLGYQVQPQPESNLLLLAQGQSLHEGLLDRSVSGTLLRSRLKLQSPYYNLQGSYLHRLGDHQLSFAADYLDGEFRDNFNVRPRAFCVFFTTGCFDHETHGRYVSLTLQDIWQLRPDLYLTGALRYDNARERIQLTRVQNNSGTFSPQAGLIWRVTPQYMLRLSAFRTVQAQPHDQLSPTQIAGFFLDTPSTPSSTAWQYQIAWDADLSATTFLSANAFYRQAQAPGFIAANGIARRQTIDQDFAGGGLTINQLLGRYFGLAAGYLRFHVNQSGVNAGPDGTNDLVRLGLFFVHPIGLSASLNVNYLHQDVGSARVHGAPPNFWLTNLGVSYEFPQKWANLTIGVNNVSNQKFDLQIDPLGRSVSTVQGILPVRNYGASLRINF